eukprot:10920064-Alexandrium_andersonii.AAC.1
MAPVFSRPPRRNNSPNCACPRVNCGTRCGAGDPCQRNIRARPALAQAALASAALECGSCLC